MWVLLLTFFSLHFGGCSKSNDSVNKQAFNQAEIAIVNGDFDFLSSYLPLHKNVVSMHDEWDQSTLLHIACSSSSDARVIKLLLALNSDPDAQDDEGKTPLHCAYKYGAPDSFISLLMQENADVSICDVYGKKPIDYKVPILLKDKPHTSQYLISERSFFTITNDTSGYDFDALKISSKEGLKAFNNQCCDTNVLDYLKNLTNLAFTSSFIYVTKNSTLEEINVISGMDVRVARLKNTAESGLGIYVVIGDPSSIIKPTEFSNKR